ncbi:hypothetical protein GCM10023345_10850 [Acinetobacter kookii]|uniref:Uncharacterized protein n=1 Tax=Acinetobacter kookii TaxID=1226327 RepID=A0A1G6H1D1_9GAMM|nr:MULTISPECIES: hypothetical protein [Acinetobacter]TCB71341.1 hypothetical protein E0H88_05610 [Acinetobacter sp. ANC 4216]SDB88069.1 hypothetical protein SAMN05421732_101575 [Acinetobacter kookii]
MAEQEGKQALMIQLPWTVPQQENTQAIILQQPNGQKVYLDLNHSTDTTAISSFALSVIIALILGGFATWLAYWYGRRSFDLTRQSFDTVIAQIKSSEQVALDLNQRLFEQQQKLQNDQNKNAQNTENLNLLHSSIVRFIVEAENFLLKITLLEQKHKGYDFLEKIEPNSYQDLFFNEIGKSFEVLGIERSKIILYYLRISKKDYEEIANTLKDVYMSALDVRNSLIRGRDNFGNYSIDCMKKIEKAKFILNEILEIY